MLKENYFLLTEPENSHSDFISMLNRCFTKLEVFFVKENFIKSIEQTSHAYSGNESCLFILFADYSFLNFVCDYLNEKLMPLNYILITFHNSSFSVPAYSRNIFEYINTNSSDFDYEFFINKLFNEISNKNRISLLQFEVRKFYEIGKSLSSEKDTMKLFEMIIDSSLGMTSSDAGTIYIVADRVTGNWSTIKSNNYEDKILKFAIAKNQSIPVDLQAATSQITRGSISGYTVITGKPLRIDDAYKLNAGFDYQHNRNYDLKTGYITKSILSIPMKDHKNNVMGLIQLINKKKNKSEKLDFENKASLASILPFDYSDELIMNSLAGQAAIALENNLLYRDMQDLLQEYKNQNKQLELLSRKILKAHEEERKRIAREIHDGPAQSVVNLSLKAELCKKYLQTNRTDNLLQELDSLNSSTRAATKEIRTIIYDLKPSYLDDGLIKALENHLTNFADSTGIKVRFSVEGVDSKVEYYLTSTIYRIVQELCSNIYKHAEASNVDVELNISEKAINLKISDNGKGFDTSKLDGKKPHKLEGGFGLEGIKERIELIKGSLAIRSLPGAGTCVSAVIPLPEP